MPRFPRRLAPVCLLAFLLPACNRTGGAPPEDLADALTNLGVDVSQTDRVDADGNPLPDDYAPLGGAASFGQADEFSDDSSINRTDEIFLVGRPVGALDGPVVHVIEQSDVAIDDGFTPLYGTSTTLHDVPLADSEWGDEVQLVDATAGDLDSDGLDESIVAYVDTRTAERVVRIRVIDDAEDGFAEQDDAVGDGDPVTNLSVGTADVDGDGAAEVILGVATDGAAELWVLAESGGDWTVAETIPLDVSSAGDIRLKVQIAGGNVDYDNGAELGVVVSGASSGEWARFVVFDDQASGFAELEDGTIQATDGTTEVAGVAHIDLGDVDGDGVDEVVLGGVSGYGRCTSASDIEGVFVVLDDAPRGFEVLAQRIFDPWDGFRQCPAFSAWELEHVFVGAFDVDGDGVDEMYANQYVFEDLVADPTLLRMETPGLDDAFLLDGSTDAGQDITFDTVAVAAGDVTGDGRENLLVSAQYHRDIPIFGVSQIEEVGWAQLSVVPTVDRENSQDERGTMLVPSNVDADGPALIYGDGSHELVFTEPMIVAVLAAAPCAEGIGQNVDACSTSFGQGESGVVDASLTVSVRAGVHSSVKTAANIPFVGEVGAEFKKSVSITASASAGVAYTVETSQVFTSGPLEDAVVFTTIPYDRYVYEIVSHPDPELVGGTVEVSLPREPILLKVERSFYNDNVVGDNVAIGANVFDHEVGTLSTYPSAARKDSLLSTYGGLENGPIGVGEGNGSSTLSIDVAEEVSLGGSLGIEVERSVEVTAGPVMGGFSVGYGAEASLTVTSGTSTTYSGTVGDLSSDAFLDESFSYGLFTYVQDVEDQKFEVVNFWVE